MTNCLKKFKLLCPKQFGSEAGFLTDNAVSTFTHKVQKHIDGGYIPAGVFVDFIKAIDTLNHSILIAKPNTLAIEDITLSPLCNYIERKQSIISGFCPHHVLLI